MTKLIATLGIAAAITAGAAGAANARPYTVFYGQDEAGCKARAQAEPNGNCFWSEGNGSWVVTYEGPEN
ncbi:hypothetical protein ACIBG0_10760 [Nocardia sp. NPDC050630]|uniref:hypothetical protein n=1 Tax=Nocardia sp. NPDC050630 TaxID=3364321 RepID=UPI0037A9A656